MSLLFTRYPLFNKDAPKRVELDHDVIAVCSLSLLESYPATASISSPTIYCEYPDDVSFTVHINTHLKYFGVLPNKCEYVYLDPL